MFRSARGASFVLLSSIVAPVAALAAHTHAPVPSTWTLSVSESDFGSGPSMKSETFVMLADNDKWAKYTDVTVDATGHTWKSSWSGPADGTPHPITGMPGGTFSTNAATDVSVFHMGDGATLTCDFSITANGKKFIEKCQAKTPDGKTSPQTLVFNRTK